jgi:hypothetical protein
MLTDLEKQSAKATKITKGISRLPKLERLARVILIRIRSGCKHNKNFLAWRSTGQ